MKQQKLDFNSIGCGRLQVLFDKAIADVLDNVADPNTKTDAPRAINIKIKLTPNQQGTLATIAFDVRTVLAGVENEKTTAFIAMDPERKELSLYSVDVRQQTLPLNQEPLVSEIRTTAPVSRLPEVTKPEPSISAPSSLS